MPGRSYSPRIALLTEVDATLYSGGVDILTVGGSTFNQGSTTVYYDDPVAYLNGRCSSLARDLQAELQAAATAAGFTLGWVSALAPATRTAIIGAGMAIADTDRMYIANNAVAFTLSASPDNATFGFPTAGMASVTAGGVDYIVASGEWVRGPIIAKHMDVDPAGAPAAFTFPAEGWASQSLPTAIRTSATSDSDSTHASDAFERGLNADIDNASKRYRCYLDADGRTVIAWPSVAGFADPVWVSADARRYLGFTGLETSVAVSPDAGHAVAPGDTQVLTSTNRCAGALCPGTSYPARRLDVAQTWEGAAKRTRSGAVTVTRRLSRLSYDLTFILPGPARDADDLRRHFIDRWLPTVHPGDRVAYYQQWGDPRRALRDYDVRSGATEPQAAYTTWQTSEFDGERGRLICRRGLGASAVSISYPRGPRVESEVSMTLDEYVED